MLQLCFILCFFSTGLAMKSSEVKPTDGCPRDATYCKFTWTIKREQAMMSYDGLISRPVVERNGSFYYRTDCADDSGLVPLNETELRSLNTLVGDYSYIMTINGQYPGPTIVVYDNQLVEIELTNSLMQESTGIHWHGMYQKNSNWMDGVTGTTQCPINPHETFTYRFYVGPVGTHWYHSHQGLQRSDGIYGALIVLPNPNFTPIYQTVLNIPIFEKEFILIASDLEPVTANLVETTILANANTYLYNGWDTIGCFNDRKLHRGVINGKGHTLDKSGQPVLDLPLTIYEVGSNKHYRFRVINAAAGEAFVISVDQHRMVLFSSDGQDFEPIEADSFFINSGERYDFYIYTNQTVGKYYVRAATKDLDNPVYNLAIMSYTGATSVKPSSTPLCSDKTQCMFVNCPFKPGDAGVQCINFESIKSVYNYDDDAVTTNFQENFLSFDRTRTIYNVDYSTINGIMHVGPSSPPSVDGTTRYDRDCRTQCTEAPCHCTHQLSVPSNYTLQIVMFAGFPHPIHLHGYHFKIMKVGYDQSDYQCNIQETDLCTRAQWTDPSWNDGNVAGMNTINPPRKDTLAIPANGYVVFRILTDNPGWWFLHCHIDNHLAQGMGMIIQTGIDDDMTLPPPEFPNCGSYSFTEQQFQYGISHTQRDVKQQQQQTPVVNPPAATIAPIITTTPVEDKTMESRYIYGFIGASLGGILVGIIISYIFVKCRSNNVGKMNDLPMQ